MNIGEKKITCAQANQMDMVEYLSSLGHKPRKIKNDDFWYCSPLRPERTPSFKVNRKGNVWYDHGLGKGGKLVDFGVLFHQCSIKNLLDQLTNTFSFQPPSIRMIATQNIPHEPSIKIIGEKKLHSLSLLSYLKRRRIEEKVAHTYCREVTFELTNKTFTAIGFSNNEGGFELRNQWFKGSSSPKAVTSIINNTSELAVFEGFFNFLSHQTIYRHDQAANTDFLILNSTSFFEKSLPFMMQYRNTRLYLDRDKTGQNCTQQAIKSSPSFSDASGLYDGYNDLNQWMQEIGKSQKKGLRL